MIYPNNYFSVFSLKHNQKHLGEMLLVIVTTYFFCGKIKINRGLVKEEYLVIIMELFFLFLHENLCCGYSLEVPQ